ncbi:thiamine-phosphate kinase [Alicyclobacillus sp. SO9]|uniref:thiamine-phosphate kinase n=1 Tax=Alicyclobacillus sp. SO9 TaxID=2665646 RepID=UPI001E3689A1|nr:thiamine-phosphate kinase [Alicyclobacillus sp. SO9]
MQEFERIERLRKRVEGTVNKHVKVAIGDDAAVVGTEPDEDHVVTTDTMVEGVHFLPTTMSWYDIGYKCMAASVSDVAAMGGRPIAAVLALAVPEELDFEHLEMVYDGVAGLCKEFSCSLAGGDLTRTSGPLVLTSTVLGAVPKDRALLRSGAQPGDVVFVTGQVGTSAAGLELLVGTAVVPVDSQLELRQAHQRPLPQVTAGQILLDAGASACNDISDGLASEANEIAAMSGVRLRIDSARIPISPAVRDFSRAVRKNPLDYAWYGGEDYQLIGTASSRSFAVALARCESVGVKLTAIGRVEAGDGVVAEDENGTLNVIEAKGFNHFSK